MNKKDEIERLYLQYDHLSLNETDNSANGNAYEKILAATKGTDKEKKLVCQFIPKFFDRFPHLSSDALNSYLDLCEDNEVTIRKEAIKGFPRFFNGQPNDYTRKFADILTQLLETDDNSEASHVRSSLTALLKIHPAGALKGIFSQVKHGDERIGENALKFLSNRIRKINRSWSIEVQDILIAEIRNSLQISFPEEIPLLFGMLLSTRLGKTNSGRKQILDMFLSYIELDKERLLINDTCSLRRFLSFIRNARALFSNEIHSNKYFLFFSKEVIPKYLNFKGSRDGSGSSLRLLRLFAEIATYIKDLDDTDESVDNIYSLLIEFLPNPNESEDAYKRLQFSTVECLLSAFYQILKLSPSYFSNKHDELKELRYRLHYFYRASKAYATVIEYAMKKNNKDVDRIKMAALRTISNINALLKDFFQNPLSLKTSITLSWLFSEGKKQKRKNHDHDNNRPEKVQKIETETQHHTYKPPIGKYSQNLRSSHSNS